MQATLLIKEKIESQDYNEVRQLKGQKEICLWL